MWFADSEKLDWKVLSCVRSLLILEKTEACQCYWRPVSEWRERSEKQAKTHNALIVLNSKIHFIHRDFGSIGNIKIST